MHLRDDINLCCAASLAKLRCSGTRRVTKRRTVAMPSPSGAGAALLVCLVLGLTGLGEGRGDSIKEWDKFKTYSVELNGLARQMAKMLPDKSRLSHQDVKGGVLLVESADRCDPLSLKSDPEPCLSKIAGALQNYSRLFGDRDLFKDSPWKELAQQVTTVIEHLLGLLGKPVSSGSLLGQESRWMFWQLQQYSVERLLSFSTIAARVFSPGDPATHDAGSQDSCPPS
ncbi:uncharacterized protein [Lepisosteus oculatus]|uniref:uncharacterized protein n=1 Tax=Lepisosteus oculatus TaxID=7918 RepID=UPI0035F51B69